MEKKYASAGKPPLPPRPYNGADTELFNHYMIKSSASAFIRTVKNEYKLKEEWSEKYNKNLAQLVLIKLRSSLSDEPEPVPKVRNYGSLDDVAYFFSTIVQLLFKVGGMWSYEYNNDLIQLALIKLRPNNPGAAKKKRKPFKKPLSFHVHHASASASPSKKLKAGSYNIYIV
ncbi:uncharacterized protein LOC125210826 [Salvia hispanica]|uniref:uncharacterized protein LOC125210826 n=1 Tax=Salvia hispanica TaxID=49212 RepID=UPI0020094A83|nr:uncharacterized protein LOC125210826 [Salvia hispanica]